MRALSFVAVAALALTTACAEETLTLGLSQPLRIHAAQFRDGTLPGLPPLSTEEINADVKPTPPTVTSAVFSGRIVRQAEAGREITGRTSTDAVAVGVRFADLGDGYWVFPVGSPDPANNDEFTFRATSDLGVGIPPGNHTLLYAALDADGRSGTQGQVELCVQSDVPDNLNVCEPTLAPPATVLSLSFDTPVDLDLRVITPNGKVVDPKHPTTGLEGDAGVVDTSVPDLGEFDGDSLRSCVDDGRRRENLIWQQKPTPGRYFVYVNLYDACERASTRFSVSLHQPVAGIDAGLTKLAEVFRQSGLVLAAEANAGTKPGLFVTEFVVN